MAGEIASKGALGLRRMGSQFLSEDGGWGGWGVTDLLVGFETRTEDALHPSVLQGEERRPPA